MSNETLRSRWALVWALHLLTLAAFAAFRSLLLTFLVGLLMDANMVRLMLRSKED